MLAVDMAIYLASQDKGTFRGEGAGLPLFINFLPDAPDGVIALFETGGMAPDDDFNGGADRRTLQVRVRSAEAQPTLAPTTAEALYMALHGLSGVTLDSGALLTEARALQPPRFLQRDANRRIEYVFNVLFRVQVTRPTYGG